MSNYINGNNNIQTGSGTVTINNKTYRGNSVTVKNNVVYIDGKRVSDDDDDDNDLVPNSSGILKVEITGNVGSVKSDKSVNVRNGNVEGDVEARGSVNCDKVGGSVDAKGSVNCDGVKGNVTAGGSVNADNIGGSVIAGGSVRSS